MTARSARTAAERWAADLAQWRIPDEILAQAPESPWIHPVAQFTVGDGAVRDDPSRRRALEALAPGGSVLDVGCGGGRAAFALTPPATAVTGVDHQASMLEAFAAAAEQRGLRHAEVLGDWPDAEADAPLADVVVCHHVAYNVAALGLFVDALAGHARRRVVLELPRRHPLSTLAPLWRHFWGLERPDGPTAEDAVAVIREAGHDAHLETWHEPRDATSGGVSDEQHVRFTRVRLCLPAERDPAIAEFLAAHPAPPRRMATVWWDVEG